MLVLCSNEMQYRVSFLVSQFDLLRNNLFVYKWTAELYSRLYRHQGPWRTVSGLQRSKRSDTVSHISGLHSVILHFFKCEINTRTLKTASTQNNKDIAAKLRNTLEQLLANPRNKCVNSFRRGNYEREKNGNCNNKK